MRRYGLYDASRGLTLALAAALAGLGLWGATQVGMQTTGRFWISMAIVAGAGLLIALAAHVGTWTKGLRLRVSPGTFALVFLPVLVCVGWILIANQPGNGWQEGRLDSWSNSIGILGPAGATAGPPADEPVAAERRYYGRRAPATPPATPTEETAQTRTRAPSR